MTVFYDILDKLEELFKAEEDINTVTTGSLSDIANTKRTMYSLAHILVNNVTMSGSQLNLNITTLLMDVVDINKESVDEILKGNDNEHDVLNTLLAAGVRVMNIFKRGSVLEEGYELLGDPLFEPFVERFEDRVAGWSITFTVMMPNDMTICD